jgi:hypothetical protein
MKETFSNFRPQPRLFSLAKFWCAGILLGVTSIVQVSCNPMPKGTAADVNSPPELRPFSVSGGDYEHSPILLSEVTSGRTLSHCFCFTNTSDAPLELRLDGVSCRCSQVQHLTSHAAPKTISPGALIKVAPGAALDFQLNASPLPRPEPFSAFARFTITDAKGRLFSFDARLAATVLADLRTAPSVLSHDFVGGEGEVVEKTMVIEANRRSPDASAPALEVSGLPTGVTLERLVHQAAQEITPGLWQHHWEAKFVLRCPIPVDHPLAGSGSITVKGEAIPPLMVPVTLACKCGVSVAPAETRFDSVAVGGRNVRRFRVAAANDREFVVRKVTCSSPYLTINGDLGKPQSKHWLEIAFSPAEAGDYDCEVVLETDHPEATRLSFPVHASCR